MNMVECDVLVNGYGSTLDEEWPFAVLIRGADGRLHVFRATHEALVQRPRLALKGRCTPPLDHHESVDVLFFAGDGPTEDGRSIEGRDFWDLSVAAERVRIVSKHSDPARPKGRLRYCGPARMGEGE